jgi:hypothetical protein
MEPDYERREARLYVQSCSTPVHDRFRGTVLLVLADQKFEGLQIRMLCPSPFSLQGQQAIPPRPKDLMRCSVGNSCAFVRSTINRHTTSQSGQ